MKDVLKIMLNGAYTNFKRILFAADRVTDMELRNAQGVGAGIFCLFGIYDLIQVVF